MSARWVEDAEGRHWGVGPPEITEDDSILHLRQSAQVAPRGVCLKVGIVVHCLVEEGQHLPDAEDIVAKVIRALTAGGSQSRCLDSSKPNSKPARKRTAAAK